MKCTVTGCAWPTGCGRHTRRGNVWRWRVKKRTVRVSVPLCVQRRDGEAIKRQERRKIWRGKIEESGIEGEKKKVFFVQRSQMVSAWVSWRVNKARKPRCLCKEGREVDYWLAKLHLKKKKKLTRTGVWWSLELGVMERRGHTLWTLARRPHRGCQSVAVYVSAEVCCGGSMAGSVQSSVMPLQGCSQNIRLTHRYLLVFVELDLKWLEYFLF